MIDVCLVKTGKAFIPEAQAYSQFLCRKGLTTVIVEGEKAAKQVDARLYYRFGGILSGYIQKGVPEIHEYHTASVGRFAKLKNLIKSMVGSRPVYYSFLNKEVEQEYFFSSTVPSFYRDMGAESELLLLRQGESEKRFDVCYFGAISQRQGVMKAIGQLAGSGLSLVVAGRADPDDEETLRHLPGVTFLGVIERSQVIAYLMQSKFGLNYIPDEYPLTLQTSTKVIEYLVAGVPVISNQYHWINRHSEKIGYHFVHLDEIQSHSLDVYLDDPKVRLTHSQAEQLTWDHILESSHFYEIVINCLQQPSDGYVHGPFNRIK